MKKAQFLIALFLVNKKKRQHLLTLVSSRNLLNLICTPAQPGFLHKPHH
jgi:hypothetical protein